MKFPRSSRHCFGFLAVEILVAIGMFSVVLAVNLVFFSWTNNFIKKQSYGENRIRLFQSLIYLMGMPSTLRGSLRDPSPETEVLKKAIQNGLGTVPASPLPIVLYLPVVAGDATTIRTSGPISGKQGAPLLYGVDGKSCSPSSTVNCDPAIYPISVRTAFFPVCPPRYDYYSSPNWPPPIFPLGLEIPSSCNRAQFIKVFYDFEPTIGAPVDLSFDPVSGSVMVSAVLANVQI